MKFSILIPAFKPQYLEECIKSILRQNYPDFEVIIVNDNSPQNLDKIVNKIRDPRIKYHKNSKGFGGYNVVGNWNKCLEYATGDFTLCMGDDDKLLPNCLQDYADIINKYPQLDVFHMRTEIIDENSNLIDMQQPRPERESIYSMIWNLWKGRDQYIGDFLFRVSTLRANGGFYFLPYAWSSDKISTFIAAGTKGIANTFRPGFQYRKNTQNITSNSYNLKDRFKALQGEKEWYKEFLNKCDLPQNEIDQKYLSLIELHVDSYMNNRMENIIFWDVTENPSHFKFWKRNQKAYGITKATISHARYIKIKEITKKIIHL